MRPGGDCPVEGCVERKERYEVMCPEHWAMCAGDLRSQLEHAYLVARVGGEDLWRAYLDVRDEAVRYVDIKEGDRRQRLVAGDTGLSGEGAAL